MTVPRVLHLLVHRVARYERPFNTQDAILILKSLHLLRYRSDEVRGICEKCAFAVAASTRITVPVERIVDVLNALLSLQAASLPIVHVKLTSRLMELTPQTASVRIAQKAAVVVMKLGRRYCKDDMANHIFDVLVEFTREHPTDGILRLAMIGVFAYTSTAKRKEKEKNNDILLLLSSQQEENVKEKENVVYLDKDIIRIQALLTAAEYLVDTHVLSTLRGNSALQALHLLPFLPDINGGNSNNINNNNNTIEQKLTKIRNAFYTELQIDTVVPGGYAQFLHDFLAEFPHNNHNNINNNNNINNSEFSHGVGRLLSVLQNDNFRKALNSYDVAKIAMAVSHALTKWHLQSQSQLQLLSLQEKEKNDGVEEEEQNTLWFESILLTVWKSLVIQLEFFYHSSWKLPHGRVDQIAVGAVWHFTQKYICIQLQQGTLKRKEKEDINIKTMKDIITLLIQLTYHIKGELPLVWSWVLYSMSMSARTRIYHNQLNRCIEDVIQASFLIPSPVKVSLRTCVQALYAISILMVPSIEEKELLLSLLLLKERTNDISEVQQNITDRIQRWEPQHPLVENLINRIQQFRYGEYTSDDVPMLLQALANLTEAAVIKQQKEKEKEEKENYTNIMQLIEKVLHYLRGNRHNDWYHKHGIAISSTLLSLEEFLPTNTLLRDITIQYLYRVESIEITLMCTALCRWMEQAVKRKRRGVKCEWSRDALISIAAIQIPRICSEIVILIRKRNGKKEEKRTDMYLLLNAVELAHELGATLSFVESTNPITGDDNNNNINKTNNNNNNNNNNSRMVVCLDLSVLLNSGILTGVDAAHILRLMSYEVHSSGMLRAHNAHISQLRHIALNNNNNNNNTIASSGIEIKGKREKERNMDVQILLHLLRANATIQSSKALFNNESLISIMSAVSKQLCKHHQSQQLIGDASRIVHALLSSQVLLRLGRSLQSYEDLTPAVVAVLDAMEANQTEKPETIFKLRLLCGA